MFKRYIVLMVVISITTVIVNVLNYDLHDDNVMGVGTINKIPMVIDNWEGTDYPLEELIYEVLETRAIIHRNYKSNEKNVFLSIVHYNETKVDFHAPEGCLSGEGVQLEKEKRNIKLNIKGAQFELPVNVLIRDNGRTKELIYYFYKTGKFIGQSYIKLRINLAKEKMVGKPKSGSLIRISTPIESRKDSHQKLLDFLEDLYPLIMENL